ncbi:hypothetical protein [Actinomadura sp. 7K507]|uniref:hypothetical protein n=1 Tax=Actinomadura sp. 7K507 TaxID=2530365 RepID=UPI001049B00A|nr:hypothetical protein [Actinomadura sp. 7K507]TDC96464.1 hypothetical protein E1285_05590 [Actinomadura sp. 7K507]
MTEPAPPEAAGESGPPVPSPPRPRKRRRKAVLCTTGYFALLVLLAAGIIDGSLHRIDEIGKVERQPATVKYEDGGVHYAGVVHKRSRLFGRHRAYELYTGRDPGLGYGYFVRLGFGDPEARPVIRTAHWDRRGVRVIFTSGHEVFVPAHHYLGGR